MVCPTRRTAKRFQFVVRVWDGSSKPLQVVYKHLITLESLMYIETNDLDFPFSTLLFRLNDGLYVLPEIRRELVMSGQIKHLTLRKMLKQKSATPAKLSFSRADFLRILEQKKELQKKQEHVQSLVRTIETKLEQRKEYFQLVHKKTSLEERVEQLKAQLKQEREAIAYEREQVKLVKEMVLPKAMQLKQGEIELLAEQKRFEREKNLRDKKMQQYKRDRKSVV